MSKAGQPLNGTGRRRPATHAAGTADPIAIGLQQLFASVAEEPVPDEFMALLDRIEAAEQAQGNSGDPALPATRGGDGA